MARPRKTRTVREVRGNNGEEKIGITQPKHNSDFMMFRIIQFFLLTNLTLSHVLGPNISKRLQSLDEDWKNIYETPMRRTRRFLEDTELQFCLDALYTVDEDDNDEINGQEYLAFVQLYGDILKSLDSFDEMPLDLRSSFTILACRCLSEPDAEETCCVGDNAKVEIFGAKPGESPTSEETQNLKDICFLTESSVTKYILERGPTASPTKTKSPTLPPTKKPTTDGPTKAPSAQPAGDGTASPTVSPTKSPTGVSTLSPTKGPTIKPTKGPTPAPTAAKPTVSPKPTTSPTMTPTYSPTKEFTMTPTNTPTEEGDVIRLSSGGITGIVVFGMVALVFVFLFVARKRQREDVDLKQDDLLVDLQGIGATNSDEENQKQKKAKRVMKSDDASSHAGSSGWSSQGGLSSMDSLSLEEERNRSHAAVGGAAVRAGVPGAMAVGAAQSDTTTNSDSVQMTYNDLDDAIQKGDWAAVGVTAALLASQSYDTQAGTQERVSINNSTLNPSRTAELDRLVEAGDWEGVVAAAARFDAQEARELRSLDERSGSVLSKSSSSPSGISGVGSESFGSTSPSNSLGSPSGTAGVGSSASGETSNRSKKLVEIRAEVESLVLHVVPEERDNVDEMMLQFQGREEELLETLRNMQERNVAQKARIEGQKRAKRDARDMVASNKRETAEVISDLEKSSTEERLGIDQLEAPKEEETPKQATNVKSLGGGTWEEASGDNVKATSLAVGQFGVDSDEDKQKRKEQQLKEEEEALAQAEIWDAIAQQTKGETTDTATDTAAQDATDWAIARSFNAMKSPDKYAKEGDDDEGSV